MLFSNADYLKSLHLKKIMMRLFISSFVFITIFFSAFILTLNYAKKAHASGLIGFEIKGGSYFQHLSGNVSIGNSGSSLIPTTISPSDIGLQTSKTESVGKIVLLFLYSNRLSFTYVPYDYSGSKNISENINFDGNTYSGGTYVTSKLNLDSYNLFYTHTIDIDRYAQLGLGVGIDVFTVSAELNDSSSNISKQSSVGTPIPLIGARIRISPVSLLSFVGKFQGLTIGNKGYYYHYSAGVNVKPINPLAVYAGYRYEKLYVDTNNVDGTLTFSGPVIELRLKF